MSLGLDVLDRESIAAYNVHNELHTTHAGWKMPPTRKFGDLYLSWSARHVLFNRPELVNFTDSSDIRLQKNSMPS